MVQVPRIREGAALRVRAVLRGRRGAGAIEFALVGALVVSLLIGSIEAARYLVTLEAVRSAAAEAGRLATLRGNGNLNAGRAACTNLTGTLDGVAARVPFLRATSLTASASGCASQAGTTTVTVTVSYPFVFAVPLFGSTNRVLRETGQASFN